MLIDSHCHLNFKAFKKDLPEIVRRAQEAGVEKIIVPGTDLISSQRAVDIAREFPGICFAAVGIHPHHAQDPDLIVNDQLKKQLENLINQSGPARHASRASEGVAGGVVAIGEIGLDNYRYRKTKYENNDVSDVIKNKQLQLLTMQLNLALIHNLPVILHCREAWPDLIETLTNYSKLPSHEASASHSNSRIGRHSFSGGGHQLSPAHHVNTNYIKPHQLHGVCHCFSGSEADLQSILTMGYYVGFDGNITYSKSYEKIVASTPLERLLIETDSPYLTPVPHRGQRNEPAYLPYVAQAVVDFHHSPLPAEALAKVGLFRIQEITASNALKLFNLQ